MKQNWADNNYNSVSFHIFMKFDIFIYRSSRSFYNLFLQFCFYHTVFCEISVKGIFPLRDLNFYLLLLVVFYNFQVCFLSLQNDAVRLKAWLIISCPPFFCHQPSMVKGSDFSPRIFELFFLSLGFFVFFEHCRRRN